MASSIGSHSTFDPVMTPKIRGDGVSETDKRTAEAAARCIAAATSESISSRASSTPIELGFGLKNAVPISREQERRIPPPNSSSDTVFLRDGKFVSAHSDDEYFKDEDIIEKKPLIAEADLFPESEDTKGIFVGYTEYRKAILQQQGTRGCTAGASGMLILDHGKMPDFEELIMRTLADPDITVRDIEMAGLKPIFHKISSFIDLREQILAKGSGIVGLSGHCIVVDNISEDLEEVRIRDPYHGWEITVKAKAFIGQLADDYCIQAE